MSLALILSSMIASSHPTLQPMPPRQDCSSAREFVTTLEYLRSKKEWALEEKTNQSLAHQVSMGCSGAAARFVRTTEFLLKTDIPATQAVQMGRQLALRSEAYVDTFIGAFRIAYEEESLDLPVHSALTVAQSLSVDFQGPVTRALQDFKEVSQHCLKSDRVSLSRAQCADLAGVLVKQSELHQKPIAPAFRKLMEFLREELGVSLKEALPIAKEVLAVSPDAADNFIVAYRYGTQEKGLALTARGSLQFALELAGRTLEAKPVDRLPAKAK